MLWSCQTHKPMILSCVALPSAQMAAIFWQAAMTSWHESGARRPGSCSPHGRSHAATLKQHPPWMLSMCHTDLLQGPGCLPLHSYISHFAAVYRTWSVMHQVTVLPRRQGSAFAAQACCQNLPAPRPCSGTASAFIQSLQAHAQEDQHCCLHGRQQVGPLRRQVWGRVQRPRSSSSRRSCCSLRTHGSPTAWHSCTHCWQRDRQCSACW